MLKDDPAYREKATYWSARTYDISTFLTNIIKFREPKGRVEAVVTYHDPCHLKKSMKVSREPREILRSIPGCSSKEMAKPDACCGSGGSYALTHIETSAEIGTAQGRRHRGHRRDHSHHRLPGVHDAAPGHARTGSAASSASGITSRCWRMSYRAETRERGKPMPPLFEHLQNARRGGERRSAPLSHGESKPSVSFSRSCASKPLPRAHPREPCGRADHFLAGVDRSLSSNSTPGLTFEVTRDAAEAANVGISEVEVRDIGDRDPGHGRRPGRAPAGLDAARHPRGHRGNRFHPGRYGVGARPNPPPTSARTSRMITGPSRTADIERVLTIGVHGPSRLVILFVDELGRN